MQSSPATWRRKAPDAGSGGPASTRAGLAGTEKSASPAASRPSAMSAPFPSRRRIGHGMQEPACRGADAAGRRPSLLNLFGYTGLASLIAAEAGAEVTHVDASKKAIAWARENQALSGLEETPIRWIVDDAEKFAAREVRRGKRYDGILLDPPKYGRGPKGEVWDLFRDLPEMLTLCRDLIAPGGFLILTAYAIRASFLSMHRLCEEILGPGVRIGRAGVAGRKAAGCSPPRSSRRWTAHEHRRVGKGEAVPTRARSPSFPRGHGAVPAPLPTLRLLGARHERRAAAHGVASRRSRALPIRWSRTSARCTRRSTATRPDCSSPRARSWCATRSRAAGRSTCSPMPPRRPATSRSARSRRAPRRRAERCSKCRRQVLEKITHRDNPQNVIGVFKQRFAPESADRPRRHLGGARPGARSRQSRHDHPHRRRGRTCRRGAGRPLRRPVRGGGGARHDGLDLPRAGGADFGEDGLIAQAARHKARLVGTHLSARRSTIARADYRTPLVLLMGNEQQGLGDKLAAACDALVRIPMRGRRRFAESRRFDGADDLRGAAEESSS